MSWIATRELVARGVPRSAIDTAVEERILRGTSLSGGEMAFDTELVDTWLRGRLSGIAPAAAASARNELAQYCREMPKGDVHRDRPGPVAATSAAAPAAPAAVSPQRSATDTLENIVGHIVVQEGVEESEARRRVLRDAPDLRQRLVDEANVDRPRGGGRGREDLRARAAAYDAIPRAGRPVD